MDLFGTKARRERQVMWAALANELGGRYFEREGFWKVQNERIEVTMSGIPLVLDTYVVSNGKTSTAYTRVCAKFARGPGFKMLVTKHNSFWRIAKWLGLNDHEVGDSAFDKHFMIKAANRALAHRLWTDAARKRMLGELGDCQLKCGHDGIELVGTGVWDTRGQLVDGLLLVAELAARDLYGREILAAVPESAPSTDLDGWPRIELATTVRVVIRAEIVGNLLVMVARTSEGVAVDPISIGVELGTADAALTARLPPAAHVPLHDVGTGVLEVGADNRASFTWQGMDVTPEQLHAGAALLGALATTADVYR